MTTHTADTFQTAQSVPVKTDFPIWKTIKLGTGLKTADDFREALEHSGNSISDCANDIMDKPTFLVATEETEVDLVVVTVKDLGVSGAQRWAIYKRAVEHGLGVCPNEVGPQLRLQYKDQPNGEWHLIWMEPIAVSSHANRVFNVKCNNGQPRLAAFDVDPLNVWDGHHSWVFIKPRK